jgi:hypothetical protein
LRLRCDRCWRLKQGLGTATGHGPHWSGADPGTTAPGTEQGAPSRVRASRPHHSSLPAPAPEMGAIAGQLPGPEWPDQEPAWRCPMQARSTGERAAAPHTRGL